MSKAQPVTGQLIPGAPGSGKTLTQGSPPSDFNRKLLFLPDQGKADGIVCEYAGQVWEREHGGELDRLKQNQQEFDARYKASKTKLSQLENQQNSTPQYVKYSGIDKEKISFLDWDRFDLAMFVFIVLMLILAIVMGAANVYANLMASGEPVFIEQPWLAVSLSMLVPAGSTALKLVSNYFDNFAAKRRYALGVYGLTAVVLAAWTIVFAMNFQGIAGGIDWESFMEPSGKGPLLVWLQLFAEILVAGALFLAAEDLYSKYSPHSYTENPAYLNVKKALAVHLITHEKLRDERSRIHARIIELENARASFVHEQVVDYHALRARFTALNNF